MYVCMYVNFRIIYLSWWQRRKDDRTESPWRNCIRDLHAALGTGTLAWRTETPGVYEELPGTSWQWLWNKQLKEKEKFIINSFLKYLLWIWKMKPLFKSYLGKNRLYFLFRNIIPCTCVGTSKRTFLIGLVRLSFLVNWFLSGFWTNWKLKFKMFI